MGSVANYIDFLMKNYPLESDSIGTIYSSENKVHKGGNNPNRPTGGFPPIYLCEKKGRFEYEEKKKKREFSTHKTAVSIKEIMEKRRMVSPFIKE